MAYKSAAQKKKLHQLVREGKLSRSVTDEYDRKSHGKDLPERAEPKARPKDPNKWPRRDRWPKR